MTLNDIYAWLNTLALLSVRTLQKASMSWMNLAGGAVLIVLMLFFTKSKRVSIDFSRLFHSLVLNSDTICLNSSIIIGSTGLETRLLVFLKVFEVLLKPPRLVPPVLFKKVDYILKSEDCVYFPKPSLPVAVT